MTSLLFLAASKMYRTPSLADTPLPDCVVSNHIVVRARILARHSILNHEYLESITEIWGLVRQTSLKHQALINAQRLENEWAITPYRLSRESLVMLYRSILSEIDASTWIFLGRVFLVPNRNQVFLPLENPDPKTRHMQPLDPCVLYVY